MEADQNNGTSRTEGAPSAHELQEELKAQIGYHKRWQGWDFMFAQVLVWVGILTSIVSTLFGSQAIHLDKVTAAVIGATPAAVLLIDRTFKFGARSSWHAKYWALLNGIRRNLRYGSMPVASAAHEFSKVELTMELVYPPLDPSTHNGHADDSAQTRSSPHKPAHEVV